MRKLTALILLVTGVLGLGGGTLCFAAEGVQKTDATTPPQTSQQQMQQPLEQQTSQQQIQEPSQRKMHRMQKTGGDKPLKSDSAAMSAEGKTGAAPNQSQRSMRKKLKEAKQKTSEAPPAE